MGARPRVAKSIRDPPEAELPSVPRVREDAVAAAFIMRGVMITGATEKGK